MVHACLTRLLLLSLVLTALIEGEEQERQEGDAPDTEGNKYMPCLLAACASGVPRVVTTALDAVVKVGSPSTYSSLLSLSSLSVVVVMVLNFPASGELLPLPQCQQEYSAHHNHDSAFCLLCER